MPNRHFSRSDACTDPVVGAILSGWRYDISNISVEMRTDYEDHLAGCGSCQRRQKIARTLDVMLLLGTTLSIVAFLLAMVLLRKLEMLTGIDSVHTHLRHTPVAISLEGVAFAGLVISALGWVLVAVATPIPVLLGGMVQQFTRHAQHRA